MKLRIALSLSLLALVVSSPDRLLGQSTAFTYQGRLLDQFRPASGLYDFQFALADAQNNGNRVGPALTAESVSVTNGLFLVTLDFGATAFDGSERWLEVGVRTNGGTAPYTRLLPSQPIASIPYATFANAAATANTAGGLADGGASLTSIPVASLIGTVGVDQLPSSLAVWATISPDAFPPATNNFSAITNALGYLPATNGFFAGNGTALVISGTNIVDRISASLLTGQVAPNQLPYHLRNWAGIAPDSKQDVLGYLPATNSPAGIASALGYPPSREFTNTGIIYVDPAGDDRTAQKGVPSRPWATATNAFNAVQSGDTIIIRGQHTIPTRVIDTFDSLGHAFLHVGGCSNVTILGAGAVLQFIGGGFGMTFSNVNHLRLSGLTLMGDRSTNVPILCGAIGFAGNNRDVEISSCRFLHWIDQGITTVVATGPIRTRDIKIHHNYFEDIGMTNAPALGYSDGTCISGFVAGNVWATENYATNVIRFFEFEAAGVDIDTVEHNAYVCNNAIEACFDFAILFFNSTAVARFNNVHITGNSIRHSNPMSPAANSISLGPCTNGLISDNIIYDNVSFKPAITTATYNSTHSSDGIIVERNQVYNSRSSAAIYVGAGSYGTNVTYHAEIRNNFVDGSAAAICSGAVYSVIEGNIVRNSAGSYPFQIINGQPIALWGSGDAEKAIVRRNILLSKAPTQWAPHFLGLGAPGLVDFIRAEDNEDETGMSPDQLFDVGGVARFVLRHHGSGSPVGLVTASPGSTWINDDGGTGNTFFVKEANTDATGWIAK